MTELIIPTTGTLEEQVSVLYKKVEAAAEARLIDTHCFLPIKKANGRKHDCPDKEACHKDGVCRNFSGREWDSMVAEEMLVILDQIECVADTLRGKVIEIIKRRKLYLINYESLEQLLEHRTQLSSGEASDYNRLSEVVFPFVERRGLGDPREIWSKVGRSKLRLITGPATSIIESKAPIEEKEQEILDLLETAETSPWREIWRQTSGSKFISVPFRVRRLDKGYHVEAILTQAQLEFLRRKWTRYAEFEEML